MVLDSTGALLLDLKVFRLLLKNLFLGGFVYADDILKKRQAKDYSIEDVVFVVTNNEKQRFFMEKDPQNGRYRIRANQGHTLKVKFLSVTSVVTYLFHSCSQWYHQISAKIPQLIFNSDNSSKRWSENKQTNRC